MVVLVGNGPASSSSESDGLGLWMVDEPLSVITLWTSDSKSILRMTHVFIVVENSLSSSHLSNDLELLVLSIARQFCLEGVVT